jgi:alpha-tubulin suppressor-like RCC1 family protein
MNNTDDFYLPKLVNSLPSIKQISAGGDHSLVITQSGQIYGFGYNNVFF